MPSYRGPSRQYGARDDLDRELDRARAGATPRTDLLEREDALDRQRAQYAMTPGVRRIGPSIVSPSPDPIGPGPDATYDEIEAAALRPREFRVGGDAYEYDPRIAAAAASGQRRIQGALGLQEEDARVSRLEEAGLERPEALRQIFGRGRTFAEERELLSDRQAGQLTLEDMRSANRMEREGVLASQRAMLQDRRLDAQSQLSMALERVRSGDRSAARALSAAEALMRSYDSQLDDLDRQRRENALPTDPFTMRSLERTESGRQQLDEARQLLDSLDVERARVTGQREGARAAVQERGLPADRDSIEQVVPSPANPQPRVAPRSPLRPRAAPPAPAPATPAAPAATAPPPRQPTERELFTQARQRLVRRGIARPTVDQIMAEIDRAARRPDSTARR